MATITATSLVTSGTSPVTETTLTGTADTFTYKSGASQVLVLRNATAGALTPIIDGASTTSVSIAGIGSIDLSAGYAVGSIAAGAVKIINTDSISRYLQGTIAITGGTGLVAVLLQN